MLNSDQDSEQIVDAQVVEKENPEDFYQADNIQEAEDEAKTKEEKERKLVELEMWGQMKRWNDINFAHRMRNMRS